MHSVFEQSNFHDLSDGILKSVFKFLILNVTLQQVSLLPFITQTGEQFVGRVDLLAGKYQYFAVCDAELTRV